MRLSIKRFDVQMDIKNKGVEIEVRRPDGTFLGDLIVTKRQLVWCAGKTLRENGVKISHANLQLILSSEAAKQAAIAAARDAQ